MARRRASRLTARVAVYYAPAEDDPLWAAGCGWLGRDPASGRTIPNPGREEVTAKPRRYGFHATLKAPMHPDHGWYALLEDATALAAQLAPVPLPPLEVATLGRFIALRETAPCPALHALADTCTTALDLHRAPSTPDDLARRRRPGLTPEEDRMLLDWGYPHSLQTWRFHMTLTRSLTPAEAAALYTQAQAHFAPALAHPRTITDICLFTQPTPDTPFVLAERIPLTG